ncbi:MAG TPA: hypothetical protein P5127_05445, partial [Oscillospiraceae bacterium]|nr:hypothetical protein [Oscillospiraceae bacterium]
KTRQVNIKERAFLKIGILFSLTAENKLRISHPNYKPMRRLFSTYIMYIKLSAFLVKSMWRFLAK